METGPVPAPRSPRSPAPRGRDSVTAFLIAGWLATLCVCAAGPAAAAESAAPTFSAADREAIHAGLDRRWKRLGGEPPANLGSHEVFTVLLEALGSGWHAERVAHLLDLADRFQDADPASPGYGNFRWTFGDPRVNDRNAVEFAMQKASLALGSYRAALGEAERGHLERILRLAVEGLRRHKVPVSYTNIFLMKTWNCIALGEALGDPGLEEEGCRSFDAWLADARAEGIHEYLSPTYTGIDLDSLGLLARCAQRPSVRAAATGTLSLFWTDLAANWFAPAERLGGAHSRDYDYLTGHGVLENHIVHAGWLSVAPPAANREAGVFTTFAAWAPPAGLREGVAAVPRTVVQRWGPQSWERAVDFVGRGFCLGSSGATYANMDKPLTMSWAGPGRTPMMNFVFDGRGDPYGARKIPELSGAHEKSLHLLPFLASVQRGPEVLLLASLDTRAKSIGHDKAALTTLAAQLVLPLMDEVWSGERRLEPGADTDGAAAVVLRKGDVALGVRVLFARGTDGAPGTTSLRNDGKADGACRLATLLAPGVPDGRGTVVLFVRAAEGLDAAGFIAFRSAFLATAATAGQRDGTVDARVAGLRGELHLVADLAGGRRLVIEGGEPGSEAALLAVNGVERGRPLLEAIPAVATGK